MSEIYYTEEHEYIIVDGDTGTVGISDYAQEQLGDVVYIELPDVNVELSQKDEAGVIESVKIASEIYAPVSGEIVEVNEALNDNPALINEDSMGKGWLYKIKLSDESELEDLESEASYEEYLESLN